jgi:hypothetical protein
VPLFSRGGKLRGQRHSLVLNWVGGRMLVVKMFMAGMIGAMIGSGVSSAAGHPWFATALLLGLAIFLSLYV